MHLMANPKRVGMFWAASSYRTATYLGYPYFIFCIYMCNYSTALTLNNPFVTETLLQKHFRQSRVVECIPPIWGHIPPITSGGMYTPYFTHPPYPPYFRTHTPYHKWWNVYPLFQNTYPLSQMIECIPPISEHIPLITSGGMYTPYFRTHTPYHKW